MVHLPAEEGQFITRISQTNHNNLVHSSPLLNRARLKDSSTWRFLANCRAYLAHLKSISSFARTHLGDFFSALLLLSVLSSSSFPPKARCSLLPALWLPHTALPGEGKGDLSGTARLAEVRFEPTCPCSGCNSSYDYFVWNYTSVSALEGAAFPDLWL